MVGGTLNRMKAQFSKICSIPFIVSKLEFLIYDSLGFTFGVFGWVLPDDFHIYKKH